MKSARFEVYQDKKKGWRFRLIAANGRIIAQGESHTRERDAWRAAKSVESAIFSMYDASVVHPIEIDNFIHDMNDSSKEILKEFERLRNGGP